MFLNCISIICLVDHVKLFVTYKTDFSSVFATRSNDGVLEFLVIVAIEMIKKPKYWLHFEMDMIISARRVI